MTKATPLKEFPPEEPNRTNPDDVCEQIKANDPALTSVNLNNVYVSENVFIEMFNAMETNTNLKVVFLVSIRIRKATILKTILKLNIKIKIA